MIDCENHWLTEGECPEYDEIEERMNDYLDALREAAHEEGGAINGRDGTD